mmetsp:Transcript_15337/g.29483  ORF Transcript_15337/g.29483 Transcript_15337/m.29483 type:complete len:275 (-) Transcript_15337:1057-1881(-)
MLEASHAVGLLNQSFSHFCGCFYWYLERVLDPGVGVFGHEAERGGTLAHHPLDDVGVAGACDHVPHEQHLVVPGLPGGGRGGFGIGRGTRSLAALAGLVTTVATRVRGLCVFRAVSNGNHHLRVVLLHRPHRVRARNGPARQALHQTLHEGVRARRLRLRHVALHLPQAVHEGAGRGDAQRHALLRLSPPLAKDAGVRLVLADGRVANLEGVRLLGTQQATLHALLRHVLKRLRYRHVAARVLHKPGQGLHNHALICIHPVRKRGGPQLADVVS